MHKSNITVIKNGLSTPEIYSVTVRRLGVPSFARLRLAEPSRSCLMFPEPFKRLSTSVQKKALNVFIYYIPYYKLPIKPKQPISENSAVTNEKTKTIFTSFQPHISK